jgi:hypothetical protein
VKTVDAIDAELLEVFAQEIAGSAGGHDFHLVAAIE